MARFQGIPPIIYGTAFKFEQSTALVEAALKAGFRGIDTAGSASAYREKLVGDAIKTALATGAVHREELYIQTKFSPFKAGKDPKLYPYDVTADITTRVEQSIESSLQNLGTDYIDCLVLHSLYPTVEETIATWKEMEKLVPTRVGSLGVSNTDLDTLRTLFEAAAIKPAVVQNRFTQDTVSKPTPGFPSDLPYPEDPYDRAVRKFCHEHDITYTPWGLLWGNPTLMEDTEALTAIAREIGVSKEVACYGCMRHLGGCSIGILCGTKSVERMSEDLQGLERIEAYISESDENKRKWEEYLSRIQSILDG
ncbi:NADP-dependent oxidoreductase domain-containing protein [Xylariales sp. PMI_506]|nr:NADP-dependent oxidoreductase domain-containing protein [Xylariales sp. PMI_506]